MSSQTVLIVDDEPDIRELLGITLSRMGLTSSSAATLGEARDKVAQLQPDLCLTDMRLPDGNGISLVEYIQRDFPDIPVAMITAHGSVETAIAALKAGAFDFISKPIELERLRNLVSSALRLNDAPAPLAEDDDGNNRLLGNAPQIVALRSKINKLARSQAPVHIHGESGVGKEVVARLIHSNGPRAEKPFIAVNCGAIPHELMESEFFGHLKGSFTGANRDKLGLFQAAEGGTLFLDEIADLPLPMQVKLLRAIQEKAVRPVGGSEEQAVDVRLLSATHKNLAAEVAAGYFRNDLFYRINVIDLQVPSLRERLEDLPVLAPALLARICASTDTPLPTIAPDAMAALQQYWFPGNVRELENILERAVALAEGAAIDEDDLQFAPQPVPTHPARSDGLDVEAAFGNLESYLEDIERQILSAALEQCRWNKTATAKLLGVSFRSLRYRLQKLQLDD
ncbi:sigma-54 dependent transcriptional regulator [Haliea sp. E1-2-M8]|uniref:sigma-54-dependent transcriptional regulator n=1 Tax=Haliea sp. E1-2-M8 TaxID=3064706 RepID=UPI00271FF87D|nr:sigma-54 dependent transcriptional regulator [Haliea sp. E1-2-M8]MDO8862478.1 sigma-54 dependent transcriptional regulator [Haliea sp. E1-2-M8]